MAGVNLALKGHKDLFESAHEKFISSTENKPCIFISYQRRDEYFANDLADYIIDSEIFNVHVYLDIKDSTLSNAKKSGRIDRINKCIQKGLSVSEYMLVVLSSSTMKSVWVPFEIGFGYGQEKEIVILNHKNVGASLPSYIETLETISSKRELDNYLKSKSKKLRQFTDGDSSLNESVNPLRDYLND